MPYKIGIDVSNYEPTLKAAELRGGIAWMAAKACEVDDRAWAPGQSVDMFVDPSFAAAVQTAYDIGVPLAAYFFDNPMVTMAFGTSFADHTRHPNSGDPRILALRQALRNKTYHAILADIERYWQSYAAHYANPSTAAKIPSTWIRDSALDLEARIQEEQRAGNFADVPIIYYTGKWFVDAYSPELDSFLATRKQFLADYTTPVYALTKGKTMTWAQIQAIVDAQTYNPKWVGNKRPELLQLTDAVIAPGIYNGTTPHAVDLDVALVDLTVMFAPGAWSSVTPPPPPPVVPPATDYQAQIDALAARIDDLETMYDALAAHANALQARIDKHIVP